MKPLPVSPRKLLWPYQRRWVDDTSRFKFALMARQTGKDFCAEKPFRLWRTVLSPWLFPLKFVARIYPAF